MTKEEFLIPFPPTNRITKVNLVTMNNIEEVYFLMQHCPQLTYLKLDSIKEMNIKVFLRLILMKMKTSGK